MLDLNLLAKELDECLEKETAESLNQWLETLDPSYNEIFTLEALIIHNFECEVAVLSFENKENLNESISIYGDNDYSIAA